MRKKIQLDERGTQRAMKLLRDAGEALDRHGVEYWLEGGTLLGVMRENRLLPWDYDLDISVKEEEVSRLQWALDDLEKKGYEVRIRRFWENTAPFTPGTVRIVKVRTKKFFVFRGDLCLDIFVKYRHGNEYLWQIGEEKVAVKSVPAHLYSSSTSHRFEGYNYRVPAAWDAYLTYRYGDWRIPIKEWNPFVDDKALRGETK